MAAYRGVDKHDILQSLKAGEAFLRQLNLGPATNSKLGERFPESFYAKVEAANDDRALTGAMLDIQRESPFVENMLVFYYHAILDTDGIGKKVYDGLNLWGAFSGTLLLDDPATRAERKAHITPLHFNKAKELENGHKIPHPSQDMRDFRQPPKYPRPPQP